MKVVDFDKEKVTLEFTSQEFSDLWCALVTVDQEYAALDNDMLNVPQDRISALGEALAGVLRELAARYTVDSPL